ncbi:TspO/MBR family protein [Aquisphaera giovannonii]|uniref:TspO/MBR family protein n=1 Tax=Aquisphaera giovannonii TaxID=406548 RepID=A0A5B9WE74_9BACT|nr:TspO/MBR family protein [Aquisphaera giovannonii]QEH38529.1 TspO/MBR family protein [Aquisphaera giovannonii]
MDANPARRNPARDLGALVISLALCFAVAGLGGYWTSLGLGPWYDGLRKPPWTPPGGVIGSVWTVLYTLMAVAAWLVWRRGGLAGARLPLSLHGAQLALNLAWPALFFAMRRPDLAFAEILLLWAAILATLVAFVRVSRPAASLLVPYLAWVSFAATLNYALWRLNP